MTLLTTLALLFLLLGTYLLSRGIFVWDGGLFVVLSLAVLTGLIVQRRSGRQRLGGWLRSLVPEGNAGRRVLWMRIGALTASLGVAAVARQRHADSNYAGLFVIWLLAVAVFVSSLWITVWVRAKPSKGTGVSRRLGAANPAALREWGAMGLLLVVAGLLRGIALDRFPANLGGDEGTQLLEAVRLVGGEGTRLRMANPFATGWYSVPTMSFAVYGLAMRVFGATVAGGRALSAIAGTLTVLTTYGLGRVVGGRRTGWIAALVVTFSAYHIHFSRLASNQIFDPLMGTVTLGLVWLALQSRRRRGRTSFAAASWVDSAMSARAAWGFAGVFAGLGWYAYFGARWITFLVVLTVGVGFLTDRSLFRRHWQGLLLFALGWLTAALPLLGWYSLHPSPFSERYRAVGVIASGWLDREAATTGRSVAQIMAQQVWRAVTAFHLTPDPTFWYRAERPLVDFVTGALLVLGLADAGLRLHWPSRRVAHLWFWSTLVMAWVMTENPPSSQRGLLLVPLVAVFASWGFQRAVSMLRLREQGYRYLLGALLLMVAVLNVSFYFTVYVPKRIYGNPTAERATVLARYMLENPEPVCPVDPDLACTGYVYVLGPPWFYWDFGTLAFMLRRFPGESVPLDAVVDRATGPTRFVIAPERIAELELVRQLYPGGTEVALHGVQQNLLVVVYDWPGVAIP